MHACHRLRNVFVDMAAHAWMGWSAGEAGRLAAEMFRAATTPAVARATLQAASGIDVTDQVGAVVAPTLVLHREGVRQIPLEVSQELAASLPSGVLRVIEGSSPALFFERTDEVVRLLDSFVTGSDGPTDPAREHPVRAAGGRGMPPTPRELEVLRLIAQGQTNAEIAHRLSLSIKSNATSPTSTGRSRPRGRADATAYALRAGIV